MKLKSCCDINKKDVLDLVIKSLLREQTTLQKASDQARDSATHAENKQENKYDTRGLEASYLAHGQSKRAVEIGQILREINSWSLRTYTLNDAIGVMAIIKLQIEKTEKVIFLLPMAGGISIQLDDLEIFVVSTQAPLGLELKGRSLDDEFVFQNKEYRILDFA